MNQSVLNTGLLILVVAVVLGVFYLQQSPSSPSIFVFNQPTVPLNPESENPDFYVTLDLTPNNVCAGDEVVGSISTNMINGACSIYFNAGSGWKHYKNVVLDAAGSYVESGRIDSVGTATFRAICLSAGSYRISNDETLIVRSCETTTTLHSTPSTTLFGGDGNSPACVGLWNPSQSTCAAASCPEGSCVFKPATLVTVARCECDIPQCTIGTAECQSKCSQLGGYQSICAGSGGCPQGYSTVQGGAYGCGGYPCSVCCCSIAV